MRLALFALAACAAFAQSFYLKDGDRVVFFGDSITDQRLYTTFTETFTVTRFPKAKIDFVHSGWGGDRVGGGAGGGIAVRLDRDVLAYKPTVVTIMLGMNDGRVRAFDNQIFEIYSRGYRSLVDTLKKAPNPPRITAIQPSPYDDYAYPPRFPGGYNATLLKFSGFIADLAKQQGLSVADLNRPVTAMLSKAAATSSADAKKIIPDRVHPGASGHLIMAGALLNAWNAPSTVSRVEIDNAARRVAKYDNASVVNAVFGPRVTWTQTDDALPMPIDMADPIIALAVNSSDFIEKLNQQIVKVTGLSPGPHTLSIDGSEIATRTHTEWAQGVNIATLRTPMWEQATRVHALTVKRAGVHNTRWRSVEVPLATDGVDTAPAIRALDELDTQLAAKQRAAAQPVAHQFELAPGGSKFHSVFNGRDLTGWHISKTNHHGQTRGWVVDNGVITGTQDKPGHGGILLTDKRYKNFEVQLEINPDYSCDSGLFLRASEKGEAYQVMLDYLDGGSMGGVYGEKLQGLKGAFPNWMEWFKRGDWNHLRARIEGDVPRIQVWLNGIKITDWKDTENRLAGGATDGHIAVQVHAGNRWIPGGKHRFRNISVKEFP